jgi:hypothetical protein
MKKRMIFPDYGKAKRNLQMHICDPELKPDLLKGKEWNSLDEIIKIKDINDIPDWIAEAARDLLNNKRGK